MVKRILRFFSSSLQTLPLSSMLAMMVLEHPPFPSVSLQTPAHSIPLCFPSCWIWCLLFVSQIQWGIEMIWLAPRESMVMELFGSAPRGTLYPDGFVFPCSSCAQSRIVTLRGTDFMYLSKQDFATRGCSKNTWLFHCNLEGEACVPLLAWGTA